MVTGGLRSRGIFVQRRRILDTLQAVDPGLRRLSVTYRREYNVPGPNALW